MSGPCPNCHNIIQGPNHYTPSQPQPLNPPHQEVPILNPSQEMPLPAAAVEPPAPPAEPAPTVPSPQPEPQYQPEPQPTPQPNPSEEPPRAREPELEIGSPPSRNQGSSGLSFPQAFVLCFFSSLLFFVLGFILGKSGAAERNSLLEQVQQKQTLPPLESTTPSTPQEIEEIIVAPLEVNTVAQAEDLTPARATLEAFLASTTVGARNAYSLNSKEVLPMMAASAAIHGEGPVSFESIELHTEGPNMKVFWVETSDHPLPFPVVMIKEADWWLVDWAGFADFYYDRLGAFARGREGPMKGAFRVLLKAAPGETSPLSPSRCLVKAPQSPSSFQVNSIAESPARRKLAEIFQIYQQKEPENFKELMSGDGIPLILEISRSGAENPTLQLDQVITTGWPPLSSAKFKKDPSSRFY